MSKLNIGDFYLKSFALSELDQASSRIQGKAISWLKNDLKRIQWDFQKAKTALFYSLEVSEAKWVLKQVKLEMNRLKVNLNEVKARKLKDLQEKVNFNRNWTNDASHEERKKTEEKVKLIQMERCKKKNRRVIRKSKRRRRKYKKIQWKRQDVKQTEKWIEMLTFVIKSLLIFCFVSVIPIRSNFVLVALSTFCS